MIPHLAQRADDVLEDVVADIRTLVRCETHSRDLPGLSAGLDLLIDLVTDRVGPATRVQRHPGEQHGDVAVLTYAGETPKRVAVLGHYDTVWPVGSLARSPWQVQEGVMTGPGCFDMKAGIVMAITPRMTQISPIHAVGLNFSPRKTIPIATPIGTRR